MAGAAANLEDTVVALLGGEGSQCCLNTRVIILLVAAVVRVGETVVVYISNHWANQDPYCITPLSFTGELYPIRVEGTFQPTCVLHRRWTDT